jgi:ABC-type Fe3+ transport system permease subunit
MLRNRGAACALAALIALASYGLWLSTHQSPNQETASHSEQRARQDIGPQSPDERIAFYTEVLAWFTGILAIVSAVQGFFLYRADRTARTSADAAKLAAQAAQKSAEAPGYRARVYFYEDGVPFHTTQAEK